MLCVFKELDKKESWWDATFCMQLAPTAGCGGYRREKHAGMCQNDGLI
jgi:hypothetical protein